MCNAAYMRDYMWRRRRAEPERALWMRAKERAGERSIPFDLLIGEVVIPTACPVLGLPLRLEGKRTPNSPSLDRIDPFGGYVSGNVRVISDRANRLKGDRDLVTLRARAEQSSASLSWEYRRVAEYVEREALLHEVRTKAACSRSGRDEWRKIADFLDHVFSRGKLVWDEQDFIDIMDEQ